MKVQGCTMSAVSAPDSQTYARRVPVDGAQQNLHSHGACVRDGAGELPPEAASQSNRAAYQLPGTPASQRSEPCGSVEVTFTSPDSAFSLSDGNGNARGPLAGLGGPCNAMHSAHAHPIHAAAHALASAAAPRSMHATGLPAVHTLEPLTCPSSFSPAKAGMPEAGPSHTRATSLLYTSADPSASLEAHNPTAASVSDAWDLGYASPSGSTSSVGLGGGHAGARSGGRAGAHTSAASPHQRASAVPEALGQNVLEPSIDVNIPHPSKSAAWRARGGASWRGAGLPTSADGGVQRLQAAAPEQASPWMSCGGYISSARECDHSCVAPSTGAPSASRKSCVWLGTRGLDPLTSDGSAHPAQPAPCLEAPDSLSSPSHQGDVDPLESMGANAPARSLMGTDIPVQESVVTLQMEKGSSGDSLEASGGGAAAEGVLMARSSSSISVSRLSAGQDGSRLMSASPAPSLQLWHGP
jgi:hypothetical protein